MEPSIGGSVTPLLWVVFFVAVLGSGIFCLLVSYHWMRYSASPTLAFFSIATSISGCLVLLAVMLGAIISL